MQGTGDYVGKRLLTTNNADWPPEGTEPDPAWRATCPCGAEIGVSRLFGDVEGAAIRVGVEAAEAGPASPGDPPPTRRISWRCLKCGAPVDPGLRTARPDEEDPDEHFVGGCPSFPEDPRNGSTYWEEWSEVSDEPKTTAADYLAARGIAAIVGADPRDVDDLDNRGLREVLDLALDSERGRLVEEWGDFFKRALKARISLSASASRARSAAAGGGD